MKNLRHKLADDHHHMVETVVGFGYRFGLAVDWNEPLSLGPIGRRVLAAFLVVALSSILVLILATVIGVDLSRSATTRAERQHLASDTAMQAGIAYAKAGTWQAVALPEAEADTQAAGAHLVVVDPAEDVVYGGPVGAGFRAGAASAAVVVDGEVVGTVYLGFPDGASQAPPALSTPWLLATTTFTVLLALLLALVFTRRLTRPLVELHPTPLARSPPPRPHRARRHRCRWRARRAGPDLQRHGRRGDEVRRGASAPLGRRRP